MAKTKSILTTLAAVGTVAAAAAVIYTKREKIRELIDDAAARFSAPETEAEPCEADVEVDLVIEVDEMQSDLQEENEAEEA